MRDAHVFNAWLVHARRKQALFDRAMLETEPRKVSAIYDELATLDAEGQRLWERCLANGWTKEDGEAAL